MSTSSEVEILFWGIQTSKYKLLDNEGVVIYKEGDIDSSDGKDDNWCDDSLFSVVVVVILWLSSILILLQIILQYLRDFM